MKKHLHKWQKYGKIVSYPNFIFWRIIQMNKTQLIDKIAKENELTKKQATAAVDAVITAIGDALVAGESVQFLGFGTFSVKEIAAHNGRNPRTGEVVEIAASRRPVFSASKTLKDKLN
jgi:DNA-binding protein HU-beta